MAANTKTSVLRYDQARPAPIMLLVGKADALSSRACQQIRSQLKQADPQLEVHDCDADSLSVEELLTLVSPSLFAERRLIQVRGTEKLNATLLAKLPEIFALLDRDTYLLLQHTDPNRGKELLKITRSVHGMIEIDCAEVKTANKKAELVRLEAARLGAKLDAQAGPLLLQAYADELDELLAVLEQLARDGGGRITADAVNKLTAGRVTTTAFAVADAALAGDTGRALTLLREAIAAGGELIPIFGALSKTVRDMAQVYGAGKSPAQLAKELGMPPWMAEKAVRHASRWQELALAQTVQLLAETDAALKGQARDPQYALEKLVAHIARRGRSA